MEVITGNSYFQIPEPCIVTLGKFDGRHRGHQKLLRRMMELKSERQMKTAVFSFDMSPNALVEGKPQSLITTNQERRNNLERIGIDYLVEYPFTSETAHMEPEAFAEGILKKQMNASVIVVGTDCSFGYKGAGDAELLRGLSVPLGFELIVIEKAQEDHRDISSTYIREELDRGNVEKANQLLGEPYSIHGTVVHGNHIGGAILGFPTANLLPAEDKHLPKFGVYVSKVYIEGTYYGGITNIGKKPTVEGISPTGVETYIFGIDQDIYGKNIEVQLLYFVRPEKKFEGLSELRTQIEKDKNFGLVYLKEITDGQIKNLK